MEVYNKVQGRGTSAASQTVIHNIESFGTSRKLGTYSDNYYISVIQWTFIVNSVRCPELWCTTICSLGLLHPSECFPSSALRPWSVRIDLEVLCSGEGVQFPTMIQHDQAAFPPTSPGIGQPLEPGKASIDKHQQL